MRYGKGNIGGGVSFGSGGVEFASDSAVVQTGSTNRFVSDDAEGGVTVPEEKIRDLIGFLDEIAQGDLGTRSQRAGVHAEKLRLFVDE